MTDIYAERRTFLQAAAGGGLTFAALPTMARAQTIPLPATSRTTPMTYTPKPMPFDPQKIKGLSEKILVSHFENNYGGAAKRVKHKTRYNPHPALFKGPASI